MTRKTECAIGVGIDGHMHAYRILDDGVAQQPECEAPVGPSLGVGEDDTDMCKACLPHIADLLGIDRGEFMAEIAKETDKRTRTT